MATVFGQDKKHGKHDFTKAGDTMGGLFMYDVVISADLESDGDGDKNGDAFFEAIGVQPVMWTKSVSPSFAFVTEHPVSTAQITAAVASSAQVTSVTLVDLWQLA